MGVVITNHILTLRGVKKLMPLLPWEPGIGLQLGYSIFRTWIKEEQQFFQILAWLCGLKREQLSSGTICTRMAKEMCELVMPLVQFSQEQNGYRTFGSTKEAKNLPDHVRLVLHCKFSFATK